MRWLNRNIITNICAAVLGIYGSTEAIAGRMNLDKAMRTIGPTIALFFTGSKDGEMAEMKKRLGLTDRDVEAAGNIGLIALNQLAHRLNLQVTPYADNSDRDYRGSGRRVPGGASDRVSSLLDSDGIGNNSRGTGAGLNVEMLDRMATEHPFLDYGRGGSGDGMGVSVAPGDDLRAIDAAQASVDQLRDHFDMPAKTAPPRVLRNWAEFNATAKPPAPIAPSDIPFPEQDDDLVASESLSPWRS